MGLIFPMVYEIVAWLGVDADNSELAIDMVHMHGRALPRNSSDLHVNEGDSNSSLRSDTYQIIGIPLQALFVTILATRLDYPGDF
jgi:hypothetical protein